MNFVPAVPQLLCLALLGSCITGFAKNYIVDVKTRLTNNASPQWKPQAIVFGIVTNKKFDMIIMIFIALNMGTMTLDHYGQSDMWNFALDNLNMGFIVVFTTECILKIFALRQYYFTEPWNVFDFVVVVLSICGEQAFLSHAFCKFLHTANMCSILQKC